MAAQAADLSWTPKSWLLGTPEFSLPGAETLQDGCVHTDIPGSHRLTPPLPAPLPCRLPGPCFYLIRKQHSFLLSCFCVSVRSDSLWSLYPVPPGRKPLPSLWKVTVCRLHSTRLSLSGQERCETWVSSPFKRRQ